MDMKSRKIEINPHCNSFNTAKENKGSFEYLTSYFFLVIFSPEGSGPFFIARGSTVSVLYLIMIWVIYVKYDLVITVILT